MEWGHQEKDPPMEGGRMWMLTGMPNALVRQDLSIQVFPWAVESPRKFSSCLTPWKDLKGHPWKNFLWMILKKLWKVIASNSEFYESFAISTLICMVLNFFMQLVLKLTLVCSLQPAVAVRNSLIQNQWLKSLPVLPSFEWPPQR